jgi:vancomycin aglycone glucosyltransferase
MGFEAHPVGVEMRAAAPSVAPSAPPSAADLIFNQFEVLAEAVAGCDAVVGAGVHQYAARSVAERHGLPCVIAAYAPVSIPSGDLPPPGGSFSGPDRSTVLQLWAGYRQGWNRRALDEVNANRGRMGLRPVDDVIDHVLGQEPWLAADPVLGPAPAISDMAVFQTGAWILPDQSPLPPELDAFLDAGPAPVYVGLGSMPAPADVGQRMAEAVRAVGRRAILSRGWAQFEVLDDPDCMVIDAVNHQALLPRLAGIVHHGGAGTTVAAARAGIPQVITPMFTDQFYWAERIAVLGVGVQALGGFNVGEIAAALDVALHPSVRDAARTLAPSITLGGAATAVRRLTVGSLSTPGPC